MTDYRKNFIILLLFSAIIMFCGLNVRELFSGDETRVAGIMTEMHLNGNKVTPKLNGADFLEYPPLYYQAGSLFFDLAGPGDAMAKLPSAVCAFLSALVLFLLARKLRFSADAALWAGVILLTGAQFFNNGRKCMVDMMLAFFTLWTLFCFYTFIKEKTLFRKSAFFLLYACGLAGGFMTKGLIGFAFPWAGLGIWLIAEDVFYEKKFSFTRYLMLGLGVLPALVPIGLWARRLYLEGGTKALHVCFVVNGIGRFTGSQGDHVEPFWYYLAKLPGLFQPWLLLFLAGLVFCIYQLKKKELPREMLLPLCCALAPVVMLHCSSAKRQVYLLPVYSSWALVTAYALIGCKELWLEKVRRKLPAFPAILKKAAAFPVKLTCLLVLALLFCSIDVCVLSRKNKKESLRRMFEECKAAEQQGFLITLNENIPERTSGAAMYYMKKHLPAAEGKIGPREIRVIRTRKNFSGKKYPDHHRLLTARDNALLPEKKDSGK